MFRKLAITLSFLLVSLFMVSCAFPQKPKDEKVLLSSKKSFETEDIYILSALDYEQNGNLKVAAELFYILYQKSEKKEYLYRSLNNTLYAKEFQRVIDTIDKENDTKDSSLLRIKTLALINLNRLDEALKLADILVKQTSLTQDYLLISSIYTKQTKYDMAVKYLESAYAKNFDENVLDKMAIILYVNLGRKKDAIAQLETHSRIIGCSELICHRLIGFYSNENNIDGILQTYLRLYKVNNNPEIAEKIVQIYGYKKEYKSLVLFLEESKTDNESLLQLYSMTKDYTKAYHLADKLYEESGDIEFLGQSAVFEYESYKRSDKKVMLTRVVSKLEKVVHQDNTPLYKNYLGFVLIDHDIDVKKGMTYIKDVLKVNPNSAYYLDSLAWGYFKLGECQKALSIMNKVVTLDGGNDPEVKLHVKKINKCIQNKKGKN